MGPLLRDAGLLWAGRMGAVRVSRWWSRQFRVDVVGLIQTLLHWRRVAHTQAGTP